MATGTIIIESVKDIAPARALGFDTLLLDVAAEVTCRDQFVVSGKRGDLILTTTLENISGVEVVRGEPWFEVVADGRPIRVVPRGPWSLTITKKR